jgi:DNA-binding NarL/FixJ family response regulator
MISKTVLALIVATPSSLQNALMALMTTIPQINAVMVAEETDLAIRMVKDHHPALIVLDVDFPESLTLLNQIKTQLPLARCILLVNSFEQKEDVIGADAVLIKGFPGTKFIRTVEELLAQT